jgi:hypothetical protein
MATAQNSLATADDDELIRLVTTATQRLVVVAPGLRASVAKAVADQWQALGPTNVSVTLDTDPEIVRLGVGDTATLELLMQTAQRLGAVLWRQPGLGIGVVVSDDNTLVFSPAPRFSAADGAPARKNALSLASADFHPMAGIANEQAQPSL